MSKEEKFDAIFLSLAQQMEGGVPELMEVYFSFLRRKTDFFTGGSSGQAQQLVMKAFENQQSKALADKKKRESEEEKKKKIFEEKKRKEQEENKPRIVEITEEEEKKILQEKEKQAKIDVGNAPATISTEEDKEENEEDKGKLKPNEGNGSKTDKYRWVQTLQEIDVYATFPSGTKSKQLFVEFKPKTLKVGLKGQTPLFEGELHAKIKPDDCSWTFDSDSSHLTITLAKVNNMEWWSRLLIGETEINTRKINPENSKMEDLDPETRKIVEKIQFDSMQKSKGLPTSDELEKQKVLQNFMKAHPEMDFSKAKIN